MKPDVREKVLARVKRVSGQVGGIQRMLEEDRYCIDILNQISAVRSTLDALGLGILTHHLENCVLGHESGRSLVWVAKDGQAIGLLGIADPVKVTTPGAIQRLHESGIKIVMATGDNPKTAAAVARGLNIDEIQPGLKPEDKQRLVQELARSGAVVAMAGDGVNDAPALAAARVGIAMGTGTDIAIPSAGITLVKGDLNGVAKALELSKAVMRNIRQNLFFAFVYNLIGVPIAGGLLYPLTGLLLNPMIAGAAMSLSSVSVIGNALRLRSAVK